MSDIAGQPPAWASFFGVDGWARFLLIIDNDLTRRGVGHQIHGHEGFVRLADGSTLGLSNLAQMCFQAAPERWVGIVEHHFRVALSAGKDASAADAMSKDFALARTAIKLRLWSRESASQQQELVAWDIAEDLVAVLTFDLPDMLVSVKRSDAEKNWNVPRDDLWRIAVANMHAEGLLPAPALDVGDGAQVHVLEGDHTFFAASHVLFLEAYGAAHSPWGAIVAVPRRHVVVFHSIIDLRVIAAINSMLNVIPRMFHEGPGSITSSLYWWTRPSGGLMRLPWELDEHDGTTVSFLPPQPFVDGVLNRLSPPPTRLN
jgi:hypothetical protein